ncbi:MAG: signal recognition particle-docking protein FtsY [Pseudomonadota bacterium]
MAFFKKLRDRMFKSSSKLEEGLEAIVQDGGTEDVPPPQDIAAPPSANLDRSATKEEPLRPEEGSPLPPSPSVSPAPQAPTQAAADPVSRHAPSDDCLEDRPAGGASTAAKPARAPQPAVTTDGGPPDADRMDATVDRPASNASDPAPKADRPGFLGRLMGRGQSSTDPAPAEVATPELTPAPSTPMPEPAPSSPASAEPSVTRRVLDDDMLESLEELLIASDMGVDTALRVASNLAEGRMGRRLSSVEIRSLLSDEIARIMEPVAKPLPLYARKPQVVLVVGVNGSGKTTTIGKLASQLRAAGKSVVIAAGDTFRAAAVEQLQVWGERAGVPVLTAPEGSDPASLAFDAMVRAEADGADLLMIDTAGRLQNRADLMEELAKIVRVIRKRDPDAPHNTLLVLDATTGQNALSQVDTFQKLADVSGLVMTKLDGTARGGVLVALADKFGLPIHAIGVGEQIDDLSPFDPEDFARALTGLDA